MDTRKGAEMNTTHTAFRMTSIAALLVLSLSVAGVAGEAKPAPAPAEEPGLILDETAYWRHFFTHAPPAIRPDALKAEGVKYLGDKYMKRLESKTKRDLKKRKQDPANWAEKVVVVGSTTGYSFSTLRVEIDKRLRTSLPPSDWMKPGFDDGDWARKCSNYSTNRQINAAFYRTRFEVADPAQIKSLKLNARYRGGIRVLLNGVEVARQHLPEGEIKDDTVGEPYPPEAYHLLDGEFNDAEYNRKDHKAKYWQKVNGYVLTPALAKKFTSLALFTKDRKKQGEVPTGEERKTQWRKAGHSCNINYVGWERVRKVRARSLSVTIPAKQLKKGENLLAIESRSSLFHPLALVWEKAYLRNCSWNHGGLEKISLREEGSTAIASTTRRRPGVQVWVEDIHRRLYAPEFFELSRTEQKARIVAARNGSYAAQVAVGTDKDLSGLKVDVAPFTSNGKAATLKSTIRYPLPHFMSELRVGDKGRRLGNGFNPSKYTGFAKKRFGSDKIAYFDHLGGVAPEKIAAKSCYPIWISVEVPKNAAPGQYQSSVTVQAEGMKPVQVPLTVDVVDWELPDPKDFTTIMGLEQSPYAVARQYKAPLWSEKHFQLLDRTFSILSGVDSDWLLIPVLAQTEFGNREDSMVQITRKKDGTYTMDLAILDKYLDLVIKHCGKPLVVSFTVMHAGNPGDGRMKLVPMEVPVLDEATGKRTLMAVDNQMAIKERRAFWKWLSTSLYEHMKKRELEKAMHWGYTWDGPGVDPTMYGMLAEFVPSVGWTKGSHKQPPSNYNKAVATAYNSQLSVGFGSRKGWKRSEHWLTYPRYWGTIIDCSDYAPAFSYRMMLDRAIAAGSRGVSRVGVDYWGKTYLDGMKGYTYPVGVPNLFVLWPGKDGPEPSVRFEILREGLQETEARIFLEQAMEKLTDEKHADLRKRVNKMLLERTVETLMDSPAMTDPKSVALCSIGWQKRSLALYQAAAEVAKIMGADLDKSKLTVDAPARGKKAITIQIRNWTAKPRAWKAAAAEAPPLGVDYRGRKIVQPPETVPAKELPAAEWLKPVAEGQAASGLGTFTFNLDTTKLEPGKTYRGQLSFTDVASNRTDGLVLEVKVRPVIHTRIAHRVYNVTAGSSEEHRVILTNNSGSEMSWDAGCHEGRPMSKDRRRRPKNQPYKPYEPGKAIAWMTATPAQGKLAAGERIEIALKATPPGAERAAHRFTLVMKEAGGEKKFIPLTVHALPKIGEAATRPTGTGTKLEALLPKSLVTHTDNRRRKAPIFFKPDPKRKRTKLWLGPKKAGYEHGLVGTPTSDTTFNIEGMGFSSFAATVGPDSGLCSRVNLAWAYSYRLHFEIYVDGKLKAHSGLMKVTDEPRAVVVNGLQKAKTIRFVTRAHNDSYQKRLYGYWGDPMLYGAKLSSNGGKK